MPMEPGRDEGLNDHVQWPGAINQISNFWEFLKRELGALEEVELWRSASLVRFRPSSHLILHH